MEAVQRLIQRLLDRAATIGADPHDDDERRLRKALLVLLSVLILPISLVWGTLFLALGAPAGAIAYLYFIVSAMALVIYSRTRDIEWLLRVELFAILLAPTISMAFVGGFLESGGVGLWGVLGALGALVFYGPRAGVRWFVAFVGVILPRSIADKLKADTATIADQIDAASILFADVVDFTPLSEGLQPAEVVGMLDRLFTHFDLLAERHGLE